ncbi:MAG: ABC transporter permease [Bacteroidales bacterium]|nr:ABC transporter permease [Bacteroidales bacterium]
MRFDTDTYREITDALMRNKRRSILTGFGIFWGLFMLLFLIGGGHGLKQLLEKNFEGFATNTVIIAAEETTKPYKGFKEGRQWNLQYKDIERLKALVPELEVVTPSIPEWGYTATRDEYTATCVSKGVEADYTKVQAPTLKFGRYLNQVDVAQKRKVCIIGERVWKTLFPNGEDPCGQYICLGGVYYQVIGVDVCTSNINLGGNSADEVTIPITVMRDILNSGDRVGIICAVGRAGINMGELEGKIRQVIARQHYIAPDDKEAMMLLNMEVMFSIVDNLFRGINFLIWLVGIGTLLAGAIGVSNIMLVVVRERTVEIGIRRAIGATPRDILSQIVSEGVILTLVAGSFGIVFSVLLLQLFEIISQHKAAFQISFGTAVAALLLLTLLGLLAGIAPARRAMNIKPVEAMRDE